MALELSLLAGALPRALPAILALIAAGSVVSLAAALASWRLHHDARRADRAYLAALRTPILDAHRVVETLSVRSPRAALHRAGSRAAAAGERAVDGAIRAELILQRRRLGGHLHLVALVAGNAAYAGLIASSISTASALLRADGAGIAAAAGEGMLSTACSLAVALVSTAAYHLATARLDGLCAELEAFAEVLRHQLVAEHARGVEKATAAHPTLARGAVEA
jgi:biopolymer transport protein ExbB/TolQ